MVVAWRHLIRQRTSTVINVVGLSLAAACCTLFYSIIAHETSFDHWHKKADRIYMMIVEKKDGSKGLQVHYPAAEALRKDFPDFELVTKVHGPEAFKMSIEKPDHERYHFIEPLVLFTDSYFLQMFDFKPQTSFDPGILDSPNEALITSSLAKKYFLDGNAVGQFIYLNDSVPLHIAGIMADPPRNTSLQFNMLVSNFTHDKLQKDPSKINDWLFHSGAEVYVCLHGGDAPEKFTDRLERFTERYAGFYKPGDYYYRMTPIKEIHASKEFDFDFIHYSTPSELIWIPAALAVIIIVIACFNFINLTSAQTMVRMREVGIRMVTGSTRVQLSVRFLLETAVTIIIAMLASVLMSMVLLPEVNKLFAIVNYRLTVTEETIFFLIALGAILLIVTGLFPVWMVWKFKPTEALKSTVYAGKHHFNNQIRKTLIVIQLSSSLFLLVASLVINDQISEWENTDMKFRTNNLLVVRLPPGPMDQWHRLKTGVGRLASVEGLSISNSSPTGGLWGSAKLSEESESIEAPISFIDEDFMNMFQLNMLAGSLNGAESSRKIVINRKLSEALGFNRPEQAINHEMIVDIAFRENSKVVISAVIENSVSSPVDKLVKPHVFIVNYQAKDEENMNLYIAMNGKLDNLENVKQEFASTFPDDVLEMGTIEQQIAEDFVLEDLMKKAVRFSAGTAMIISAIGLFGVISFMSAARRKEMSIRKVNGALSINIVKLFLTEFLWLVLISFGVTAPLTILLINRWLGQYVNRISLQPIHFVLGVGGIVIVTLVSILYRTLETARVNPAETLRAE